VMASSDCSRFAGAVFFAFFVLFVANLSSGFSHPCGSAQSVVKSLRIGPRKRGTPNINPRTSVVDVGECHGFIARLCANHALFGP
jgi:hypothetical protein